MRRRPSVWIIPSFEPFLNSVSRKSIGVSPSFSVDHDVDRFGPAKVCPSAVSFVGQKGLRLIGRGLTLNMTG